MTGNGILVIFGVILILSIALFACMFTVSGAETRGELAKEAGSALLQLGLAGTLGIFAKYLLDQYAADRQKREEKADQARTARETRRNLQIQALNMLTSNYRLIMKSLHIIDAHLSAKSYGEQVREILDYQLDLQRLNNEISAGMYGFQEKDAISASLTDVDRQLEEIVQEWRANYLELSRLQKQDEATNQTQDKQVPNRISNLPVLKQLRENQFEAIHTLFEGAFQPIREQLAASLYQAPELNTSSTR